MPANRELGITPKGWSLVEQAIERCGSCDPGKVTLKICEMITDNCKDISRAYGDLSKTGLKRYSDVAMCVECLKEAI